MLLKNCSFFYNELVTYLNLTADGVRDMIEEEFKNERVKTRMLTKLGIDRQSFYRFPTLSQLIEYHIESDRCEYKVNPDSAFDRKQFEDYDDLDYLNLQ